ncbi:uncharacterized protein IL334_002196 [Kwoniella shivajii]|uniref:alpha-L-rhamnosidase n=1 Tax=Kwoniella shivajii TaxID=564305 RepID=A0ABZ1CU67_9TREE|nr:hypothetical protein IL334_002196 [Kwoniella shivajii]
MSVQIQRVQCEHYQSAIGIGESRPRLSWRFEGEAEKWTQVSYDIRIQRKDKEEEEVYRKRSAESVLVPWPSAPLKSREVVDIGITSHGSDGTSSTATLKIEAAFFDRDEWKARPVTNEKQGDDKDKRPFRLRKSFPVSTPFLCARLYITSLGVYEASINGKRVGQDILSPGWTDYNYHLNYSIFDVTDLILSGQENLIGAWVGTGWYAGRLGFRGRNRNVYGNRPALIAQLEIDGEIVAMTDSSWEWSYGALIESELYDGEVYDTRLEDSPTIQSNDEWSPVDTLELPAAQFVASQNPPVRQVDTITPKDIIMTPSGKTVIDFGQNFAGVVELLSNPPADSTEIILRHAEVLEHGELGTRPLRACKATDRIILGGSSMRGYKPKFTCHGFRYLEVSGWSGITIDDVQGVVLQSVMERTGHFSCSHPLINRLYENVVWSWIGNSISIPTDCPQRDERLGWTGDIQVFATTASFLYDTSGFLASWLKDLYKEQKAAKGVVPVIVPDLLSKETGAVANRPFAIWGDSAVLTPFDLYESFSDIDILKTQYDSMIMWLNEGVVKDHITGLWSRESPQLGDWLAPKADPRFPGLGPTDNHLVADVYLIHTTRTIKKVAELLGRNQDVTKYQNQIDSMLKSFCREYITESGRVISDTQTALALILHFNIADDKHAHLISTFTTRLSELVTRDLWQVNTGFAGTPIILHTLAEQGLLHHAYRMLQAKDSPSWLSCVLLGATTIWERWDSMMMDGTINKGSMTSFNHYALGSVASFLHSIVGGLSPLSPGWKDILIKPQPGGTITQASVSFVSPYGKISCDWVIEGGELQVQIVVPPNTSARIEIPGQQAEEIGSGKKSYTIPWKGDTRFPPPVVQPPFTAALPDNWLP